MYGFPGKPPLETQLSFIHPDDTEEKHPSPFVLWKRSKTDPNLTKSKPFIISNGINASSLFSKDNHSQTLLNGGNINCTRDKNTLKSYGNSIAHSRKSTQSVMYKGQSPCTLTNEKSLTPFSVSFDSQVESRHEDLFPKSATPVELNSVNRKRSGLKFFFKKTKKKHSRSTKVKPSESCQEKVEAKHTKSKRFKRRYKAVAFKKKTKPRRTEGNSFNKCMNTPARAKSTSVLSDKKEEIYKIQASTSGEMDRRVSENQSSQHQSKERRTRRVGFLEIKPNSHSRQPNHAWTLNNNQHSHNMIFSKSNMKNPTKLPKLSGVSYFMENETSVIALDCGKKTKQSPNGWYFPKGSSNAKQIPLALENTKQKHSLTYCNYSTSEVQNGDSIKSGKTFDNEKNSSDNKNAVVDLYNEENVNDESADGENSTDDGGDDDDDSSDVDYEEKDDSGKDDDYSDDSNDSDDDDDGEEEEDRTVEEQEKNTESEHSDKASDFISFSSSDDLEDTLDGTGCSSFSESKTPTRMIVRYGDNTSETYDPDRIVINSFDNSLSIASRKGP